MWEGVEWRTPACKVKVFSWEGNKKKAAGLAPAAFSR